MQKKTTPFQYLRPTYLRLQHLQAYLERLQHLQCIFDHENLSAIDEILSLIEDLITYSGDRRYEAIYRIHARCILAESYLQLDSHLESKVYYLSAR